MRLQPALHAQLYFDGASTCPEVYTYFGYGPFASIADVYRFFEYTVRRDPTIVMFAIIDKTHATESTPYHSGDSASFAGHIALLNSTEHSATEIGHVCILKPFQRTHVTTNAAGLLLSYCLSRGSGGGLGLRRVQWQTNVKNAKSRAAAEKLGFKTEGVRRWEKVLPEGKDGEELVSNDGRGPGRHNATYSICWDDWANGVRESVESKMVLRK